MTSNATLFQIRNLEERIADFESALTRFSEPSGWADPLAEEFQTELDLMKGQLAQLCAPV